MRRMLIVCTIVTWIAGCMVGPDYMRPSVDTPASWRFEEKEVRDLANTAWWEQFNDSVLNELVATALQENKDLRIATARIEEFFGRYFSTRGDQYPLAGGSAGASRQRLSEKNSIQPIDGKNNGFNFYQAFLGATWELDFWGKYQRATEAARAELLATEESRRTVVLTLVTGWAVGISIERVGSWVCSPGAS